MNTKRQTIWLVSMLSLMVVLSAYYLFTEDVDQLNSAAEQKLTDEVKVNTTEEETASGGSDGQGKSVGSEGSKQAASDETGKEATAEDGKPSGGLTDEEVLKQLEEQVKGESDFFATHQRKWADELEKQADNLQSVMTDNKQDYDTVSKAYEDWGKLEERNAKQKRIEETLMKDGYNQAVLIEENGKWKIVVQAGTLEKSEAVSIIDLVSKELNVAAGQITVQYLKN